MTDGILLVDKPPGITSHDAVDRVRRALGVRKVGHAGTLDPMATGLLVLGVGRGTRLLRFLGDLPKTYEGTGVLGVETTTLDADGEVVRTAPEASEVSQERLRTAMRGFLGEVEQRPPAYSAVKVGGERLYRAARAGREVQPPLRKVRVEEFELLGYDPPTLRFRARVSGGTYVRSLIADVGARLGCGAHLAALRRTAVGHFLVRDARPPEDPGEPLPLERGVEHLPALDVDEEEAAAASYGRPLGPSGIAGPYRLLGPGGRLLGVYRDQGAKAVPEVVLAPA